MKNFRRINLIFVMIGIILIVIGFIKHPGIPYQDPTLEMLLIYNKEAKFADEIQKYGFYILLISLGILSIEIIINKNRRRLKT